MYECHLTVNSLNLTVEEFKRIDLISDCTDPGSNPKFSYQIFEMPYVRNQWLITFKTYFLWQIMNDLDRLKRVIEKATLWPVVRVKIECHPDMKLHEFDAAHREIFDKPIYCESHTDVLHPQVAKVDPSSRFSLSHFELFRSRNILSTRQNPICFTIRQPHLSDVQSYTESLVNHLHKDDWVILDSHIEKCILDTNQDLDKGWIT